ncbi:NUDIX hydrolase [Humibacter sp. RRB41]|uniref:NUDIX hydrolase n=1 Tax=Humibacter sp. RRB41 TaxID=2919946 RepID=UPI001FAA81CD|nr:NUDIX domain-containing protein [Humibacter sp. RRB41]
MLHDDVLDRLTALPPSAERDEFIGFVEEAGDASVRRDGGAEHVTASCFVFSPDLKRTLLCFHCKGRFWVQLGGHLESEDTTAADGALREAHEESGIDRLRLLAGSIVDLERHELHGGFSCRAHWDLGFVALIADDADLTVSEESEDVRWFAVDTLPESIAEGLERRLNNARRAASSLIV